MVAAGSDVVVVDAQATYQGVAALRRRARIEMVIAKLGSSSMIELRSRRSGTVSCS